MFYDGARCSVAVIRIRIVYHPQAEAMVPETGSVYNRIAA